MTALLAPTKRSNVTSPRTRRRRVRRTIAVIVAAVTMAAGLGATWQHVTSERSRAATPPPGEMIDVGGRDLHLHVSGDGAGPTVVLEAAMFGFSAQWTWMQRELAAHHTVVAYDRPGLGWSDPDPHGVDPDRIADDLHTALQRLELPQPWVLVGHSMGGLFARTFADRYPDDVAAVVLLDATHPELTEGPMAPVAGHAIRLLGRTGVLRATGLLGREAAGLPAETLDAAMPILTSNRHIEGATREMRALPSLGRRAANSRLEATPLTVITAGDHLSPKWHAPQRDLTTLSSSSRHVVVPDADHKALATDPRHARTVTREVTQVIRTLASR